MRVGHRRGLDKRHIEVEGDRDMKIGYVLLSCLKINQEEIIYKGKDKYIAKLEGSVRRYIKLIAVILTIIVIALYSYFIEIIKINKIKLKIDSRYPEWMVTKNIYIETEVITEDITGTDKGIVKTKIGDIKTDKKYNKDTGKIIIYRDINNKYSPIDDINNSKIGNTQINYITIDYNIKDKDRHDRDEVIKEDEYEKIKKFKQYIHDKNKINKEMVLLNITRTVSIVGYTIVILIVAATFVKIKVLSSMLKDTYEAGVVLNTGD